jgi:hypothetical protein
MGDTLRITVWVGAVAVGVAAACLAYLLSQNLGSRNIALATGALAGAVMLLGIQLVFELRADERIDFITAEYTIDRAKPEIHQWKYDSDQSRRLAQEVGASGTFATAHPGQFDGDRDKLTHDMVIFSVLAYFAVDQFDWQMKRVQFVSQTMGTLTTTALGSKPGECTMVTKGQLHKMLSDAGNFFADANMFSGPQVLCLPPQSKIQVSSDGLLLTNPLCDISFTLEPSGSVAYYQPGTGAMVQPTLPNGEPKLETRITGIRVTVRCSALRAQHRDMPKYQDWTKRIVSGAQNWFMGKS